jgi:hypothetical protein
MCNDEQIIDISFKLFHVFIQDYGEYCFLAYRL